MDLPNDTFFQFNPATRIQWDGGPSYYRDAWQWDMCPTNGYQCRTYDSRGNHVPSYDEPPSAGVDMGLLAAWTVTKGKGAVVAIADGGCDTNHPDIRNRIIGGIAISPSTDWQIDNTGHGTAVASVIAAEENNATGIVGIAPEASLYVIKCQFNSVSLTPVVDAAIKAKADVLVLAWGFTANDPKARESLLRAGTNGISVVCAGLNGAVDEGSRIDYPIQWQLPNVIAVTSSTMADEPYPAAAYSSTLLHLHAPGRIVVVAKAGTESYMYTSGTSFAAAKVAGALALEKASNRSLTAAGAIRWLVAASDKVSVYNGKNASGGRVNYKWPVIGVNQTLRNRELILKGPAGAVFSVSVSYDLKDWLTLPPIYGNTNGDAVYPLPWNNEAYYKTTLIEKP